MLKLKLLKYKNMVGKELKKFTNKYLNRSVSKWDREFLTELNDFILNGGKRLRPILATIIYEGTGGKNIDSFIKVALSAEILHTSTLIHDDLIDDSDIRRGKSSFHKRFEKWFDENQVEGSEKESKSMAILAGDYLNFLSLQCVLDSDFSDAEKLFIMDIIRNTSEIVIKGQILDDELSTMNVKESDYIKLIEMKTASVFEYSTKVATKLSGVNDDIAKILAGYSKKVGCAFQIQDDILGIFGKEKELGKPVTTDLAEGKKTILIIKAYEFANKSQKDTLDGIIGNRGIDESAVEEVKKILKSTKALDYAEELSKEYTNDALNLLKRLKGKLKPQTYNILEKLPRLLIGRSY